MKATTKPAQFTPGPWNVRHYRVAPTNCQWADVTDSTGGLITHVPSSKGNAALIAAAPAMYEALSELVKYLREEVADEALDTWAPVFKAAMALAQAEGRQG